jgi:hypothetical protein
MDALGVKTLTAKYGMYRSFRGALLAADREWHWPSGRYLNAGRGFVGVRQLGLRFRGTLLPIVRIL